jgi:hypothetical protein
MMYRPTKHRGEGDNFLRCAVFPIRDASFGEIKHQFGYTALYVLVQSLNYSLAKHSRYLRALPFLRAAFYLEDFIGMPKNEVIYASSSRFDLDLRRTIIHDFSSRDWCPFFGVLLNPVENLLLMIVAEGDMLSAFPGLVQPLCEAA